MSAAAAAPAPTAAPAQGSPDDVLAENARTRLTRADYDADIQRVPPQMRDEFASSASRLSAYLTNLLIVKTLAADARLGGIDKDPLTQQRIALEVERQLADAQLRHIEQMAGAEFDAKADEFKVKAKEIYLVDKSKYRTPEQVAASRILIDIKKRKPEEALAIAQDARKKLIAGADFATLAKEVSDDPAANKTGGELGWFTRERVDPEFADAVFGMAQTGDISEPTLTRSGYHVIRLEGRKAAATRPFEAVEPQIMAELRQHYISEKRETVVAAIRTDPTLKVNQPAVDGLVFRLAPGQFGTGRSRAAIESLRPNPAQTGNAEPK
jgi:peptidyl-prolyl cis-trans isomerase C